MAKFNNECPICLNIELDYDALEPVDETIQQEVHCGNCNTDFKICASPEWYVLLDKEDNSVKNFKTMIDLKKL